MIPIPDTPSCMACGHLEMQYHPTKNRPGFYAFSCLSCGQTSEYHFKPSEFPMVLRKLGLGELIAAGAVADPHPEVSRRPKAVVVVDPDVCYSCGSRVIPERQDGSDFCPDCGGLLEKPKTIQNDSSRGGVIVELEEILERIGAFKKAREAGASPEVINSARRGFAETYKSLKTRVEALALLIAPLEEVLKGQSPFAEFFEDGSKVVLTAGAVMTTIKPEVVDLLTKEELKKVASITESSLEEIQRKDLIVKYKVTTGAFKAPSLSIKRMTKEEIKAYKK